MVAAIFGFVGVIAGALLTTGLDLWAKSRDGTKTRKKAARFLLAEMSWIVVSLQEADKKSQAPRFDTSEMIEVWREYRGTFADLAYTEWKLIESAVRLMAQPIWASVKALSPEELSQASREERAALTKSYTEAIEKLGEASSVLIRYAGDEGPKT